MWWHCVLSSDCLMHTLEPSAYVFLMFDSVPSSFCRPPLFWQLARAYETEGFMFKDGDFTEEELSKYVDMDMGLGADLPDGDLDLNDPEVRSAFGLD